MNKPIDMKKLIERLENINEEAVVHVNSTRSLASDIVMHAKAIAEEHGYDISTEHGSQAWEGIMRKQLSDAIQGLKEYVSEKRVEIEYHPSRMESITETTSEQYEVMLDQAIKLGNHIASNVILGKQMNPDVPVSPEKLASIIDQHAKEASERMVQSAHHYLQQHLHGGPKGF